MYGFNSVLVVLGMIRLSLVLNQWYSALKGYRNVELEILLEVT